jgi:hypothetical protein
MEISRIKRVMFTIKPFKFRFSSQNIHSDMDISNDVKYLGTPCISEESKSYGDITETK